MKQQEKTKDQAVGDLLRAYVSRPTNPHQVCPGFDSDLANAYVERQLSGLSLSKYENHLSTCAECRSGVLTLARLAHAENPTTLPAPRPQAGIFDSLQNVFRSLTAPQWAMATAAVLVLAISIPVLLSRSNKSVVRSGDAIIAAQTPEKLAEDKNSQAAPPSANDVRAQDSIASAPKVQAVNEESQHRREAESPAGAAAPAREDRAAVDALALAKVESKQQAPAEQTQLKTEGPQQTQQPSAPSAQASGDTQQAKKEDTARQQEKDVAQAPGQKPESQSVVVDEKAKIAENEKVASPPPTDSPRSNEPTRPLGRSRAARLGLRDSSGEAVPPRNADREIRGKKFYLKDGTWTDRDYNPDKDLPIITLIRDSNVYKEVLNRRASLKPFLDYFAESERAIIVYKGTVYKLIPQAADK